MAIAVIDMSSCGKAALRLGYTLLKFGKNWLSFVENITVLLQHVNLSYLFRLILLLHFLVITCINPILDKFQNSFLTLCNFDLVIPFF